MNPFKKKLNIKKTADTNITIKTQAETIIDLPRLVAETKAVPLLWGEGWTLNAEEGFAKDRLTNILETNGIDGLFKSSEVNLSMREEGNQLFIIQPDTEGNLHINIADMDSAIITGDQNGNINYAQIFTMLTVGSFQFRIMQRFIGGTMTTILKQYDPITQAYDKPISGKEFNSLTGYKLLDTWEYGDVIPLIMFTNKSSDGISDAGDAISVRGLQNLLNTTMSVNNNELLLNTTRVLVKQLPSTIKKGKSLESAVTQQMFIEVDGQTDGVQVMSADPKLDAYMKQTTDIIKKYIDAAPYSTESDFNGTQTQVGVMFQGKADIETTRIKQESRELQVNQLLDLIIHFDSMINVDVYLDETFEISINSFNVLDAADKDVKMDRMIELGIVSQRDIIAHYYNTEDDDRITQIIDSLEDKEENVSRETTEEEETTEGEQ